jgi:hypothetical protein
MRFQLIAVLAAMFAAGCANQQLRLSTVRQSSTLPDVQERQVLENFARLAANPGELPYFAVANQGTATVNDAGSTSLLVLAAHRTFPLWEPTPFNVSRSIAESWQLVPENNPDRLKAMRAAYLTVMNPFSIEPKDESLLQSVLQGDPSYALSHGWIGVGGKWDVPKHAWLVSHCGAVYVWVMPEDAAEFSRFVLLILHIETVAPGAPPAGAATTTAPAGPHVAPSAPSAPTAAPPAPTSPFAPRLFDQPSGVNSGLFFVPRT